MDAELNAIKATTDAIRANLAIIQRDDTLLSNNTVHPDAFTVASQALIAGSAGWLSRGAWLTGTAYAVKDFISLSGSNYVAVTTHTSGTFATELAAGKWQITLNLNAAAAMASSLQLASSPWQYRLTATDQQTPSDPEQPVEVPRLGDTL